MSQIEVSLTGIYISIVIPTFRRESNLAQLFEILSVQIASLSRPVEVVLVDNSPEASAATIAKPDYMQYFHEPRPGVAHARNRGVAEALGRYVIFLDDDELPAPGWLAAFAHVAADGQAHFGAIEPSFETSPSTTIRQPLDRLFSRRFDANKAEDDISSLRAFLGSGNSLFDRAILTSVDPPFDIAFNDGGEDVFLFRQLVDEKGIILKWCPEALVHEVVPTSRCTLPYVRQRLFNNGQLRCLIESDVGGIRGFARVAFWMAAGAIQLMIGGVSAVIVRPASASLSVRLQLVAVAGAGKLLWWRGRHAA